MFIEFKVHAHQLCNSLHHKMGKDGRTGVSQMRVTIDGWTTDIHTHMRGVERLETFLLPRQRIVNNQF